MRRFAVRFLILVALVWGGWWYLATSSVHNRLNTWLEDLRTDGLQAEVASVTRAGFPLSIITVVDDVSLTDPATQNGLRVPQITLSSPIYWPGHATVTLPAEPVIFTSPQGVVMLGSDGAQAALRLHPDTLLQLEALSGSSSNVTLDLKAGRLFSVEKLRADVQQGRTPETYKIGLTATGIALGAAFVENLALPAPWPDTFEPVVADMAITFDRPWDRTAMYDTRPQPREIRINEITAGFADSGITVGGEFTVDAAGIPTGALRLRVRNWQGVFEMAVASSTIPPEWVPTVERMLQSMSDTDGTLDLTVTAQNGQMRMGFLTLGSAPRLVIR